LRAALLTFTSFLLTSHLTLV